MRNLFLAGAALACFLCVGAAAQGQKAFSVEQSSLGDILEDARAKAVLAKHYPELINSPRLAEVRERSLADVAASSPTFVEPGKLAATDADLKALNPAAANAPAGKPAAPAVNEWITWGYDQERTGWNRAETTLTTKNVSKLKPLWNTALGVPVDKFVLSTVTSPVLVAGVATPSGAKDILIVHGADDRLFALDAATGAKLWEKSYPNPDKAKKPRTWLCADTPNATPTIDKARGLVFFIPTDGKLRAVSLVDGADKMAPVDFVAPFARAWSLNLIDNVVYSPSGRACGEVPADKADMYAAARSGLRRTPTGPLLDASAVQAADVSDLGNPKVTRFYTSGARPAAPWGRGGVVKGAGGVFVETSDGMVDMAAGDYSESVLKLAPRATRLMDSFTPKVWRDNLQHDLAGSASPVVFEFAGKTLLAVSQKESVLRILDATKPGGADHSTALWESPHLGNDAKTGTDPSRGVWGAITTYESGGRRFLYVPLYGEPSKETPVFPVTNGETPNGKVMAFEVKSEGDRIFAVPLWTSHDMIMPDPPVVANGVVYALSTGGQAMQNGAKPGDPRMPYPISAVLRSTPVGPMVLYAYDAISGKKLWDSGKALTDWVHFSEPVVALGKVFVVTHDAHVVAFGLKK